MSPAGTACSRTFSSRSLRTTSRSPTPSGCSGDELLERAEILKVDLAPHLRGAERGAAAEERAKAAAAAG